jgi:DNA/RNA-binding domain of Phe-tRNA-synthetase-like protein
VTSLDADGFTVSESWRAAFPGAAVGALAMRGVENSEPGPALQPMLESIEREIRDRYAGLARPDLQNLPRLKPYVEHYGRFGKTYHVLLQLESVAFHGRPIARRDALVSAMFGAELDTSILTAGHDAAALRPPIVAYTTAPGDAYIGIGGKEIDVKAGDMAIRDTAGILSAVIYGPDERTRLRPETESVIFTAYAPAGVDDAALEEHLGKLERLVRAGSPGAATDFVKIARA